MVFAMSMLLALALTIPAYILRMPVIAFAGAGAWVVFAVQSRGLSTIDATGRWDVYFGLFLLACGMVLVCALEPAIMKGTKQQQKEDQYADDIDATEQYYDKLRSAGRVPRLNSAASRRRYREQQNKKTRLD